MKKKLVFFLVGMALFVISLVLKTEGMLKNGQAEIGLGLGLLIVFIPLAQVVMSTLKKK